MFKLKDKNVNVFIVDDDELLCNMLYTKFTKTTNYHIHAFPKGEELIAFLQRQKFSPKIINIVIMDYIFKDPYGKNEKKGIYYIEKIKKIFPSTHFIILTDGNETSFYVEAHEKGVSAIIKKNDSAFLQLQNHINYIISEIKVKHYKQMFIKYLYITSALFLMILVILLLSFYFRI
ncbi:MAG: response regulator [Bacteroidales bacterium]|nr:response regulator [Bacteroidales bacterium]